MENLRITTRPVRVGVNGHLPRVRWEVLNEKNEKLDFGLAKTEIEAVGAGIVAITKLQVLS